MFSLKDFIKETLELFFTTPIALSNSISHENRHGIVFVKTKEGGQYGYGMRADNPDLLIKPTRTTIKNIFEQIEKMGMVPISINVTYGNQNTCYLVRDLYPEMAVQYGLA